MNRSEQFADLNPVDANYAVDVVDRMIEIAKVSGASDIHLQPRSDGWDLLLRIDGVLSSIDRIAASKMTDPVTRLMVLAGLPTYRSTQPMEGRLRWKHDHEASSGLSMRLGVYPTVHGPRAVVRILRKDNRFDTIESLGFSPDVTGSLGELCAQTDGAILITGPAGSGKTTTLYAMLRRIASFSPRRSVIAIEDPVESVIDEISQSEIDVSGGMTLASALRSAVRQDSEVLLVSEVRDPETAEAVMQASLTGHLVFSSLHASDCAATLRRLVQLRVPVYAIRSGVRAIITQRLLRRQCPTCQGAPTAGCESCLGSGYRGRVAIAQCIRLDPSDEFGEALADALESGLTLRQMRSALRELGADDLRSSAIQLAEQGVTSQAEVYRIFGANESKQP